MATIEYGDEWSDNEGSDSEDLSDLDLDDIPENIDDKSPVEGEDVYPHLARNTRFDIVIRNNLGDFMIDVDLNAALALEFSENLGSPIG